LWRASAWRGFHRAAVLLRLLKGVLRQVCLAGGLVGQAEGVVGLAHGRLEFDRVLDLRDRLLRAPQLVQRRAEPYPGHSRARVALDGLFERFHRGLIVLQQALAHGAPIGAVERRPDGFGLLVQRNRRLAGEPDALQRGQAQQRLEQVGTTRKRGFVFLLRRGPLVLRCKRLGGQLVQEG